MFTGLFSSLSLLPSWWWWCVLEEGPDPAEEFTVVRVAETKVAFKTAYGRYVSVNAAGELVGRMEAIGPRETWEPVFEEVGWALREVVSGSKFNDCLFSIL